MKDSEKLNLFKETLKKAKEGTLYQYDLWLEKNGISQRYLTIKRVRSYFHSNKDKIIGFDNELKIIAQYIGTFHRENERIFHIPVIGVKGSGKTLFLLTLTDFIRKSDEDSLDKEKIGYSYFSPHDTLFVNFLAEKDVEWEKFPQTRTKKGVKIIDLSKYGKHMKNILKNYLKVVGNAVYITSWTPENWLQYKDEIEEILPTSKEIVLNTMPDVASFSLFLENFFKAIKLHGKEPESHPNFINIKQLKEDKLDNEIYLITQGIPIVAFELYIKILEQIFQEDKEKLDKDLLYKVANSIGLGNIHEVLSKLSQQHLAILKYILVHNTKEGVRPKELADEFKLDKSTISYHLKTLRDMKFIEVEKIGKSSFYRVKKILIPFIQLKFLEEIKK